MAQVKDPVCGMTVTTASGMYFLSISSICTRTSSALRPFGWGGRTASGLTWGSIYALRERTHSAVDVEP